MQILDLVRSCSAAIYVGKAPSAEYQDRVTRMLMGTAAKESDLQWRRQRTALWGGTVGGFGLWQVEYKASVMPSLCKLADTPELLARSTQWLWQDEHADGSWIHAEPSEFLFALRGWDRLGCLMARLHYLRVAAAIPDTLDAQAEYWLKYYNGGGVLKYKPRDIALLEYRGNYERLVQPLFDAAAA